MVWSLVTGVQLSYSPFFMFYRKHLWQEIVKRIDLDIRDYDLLRPDMDADKFLHNVMYLTMLLFPLMLPGHVKLMIEENDSYEEL